MNIKELSIWVVIIFGPFYLGYIGKNSEHMIELAKNHSIPLVFIIFPLFGRVIGLIEGVKSLNRKERKGIFACILEPVMFWSFAVGTCIWAVEGTVTAITLVSAFFLVGAVAFSLRCLVKILINKIKYSAT